MSKAFSFDSKVLVGTLGIVVFSILTLTGVTLWQVHKSMREVGGTTIGAVGDTLHRDVAVLNDIIQEKVTSDLVTFERLLAEQGVIHTDPGMLRKLAITNQVTKQQENAEIPALTAGGAAVDDNVLVDKVRELAGGTATIFQVLPGKLLRVSTNVKNLDGSRAIGTYIPQDSPVYKAVMNGEVFRGRAFVVNTWYVTAYKPLRDPQGAIAAVIYVGRPILSPESRKMIVETSVRGKGHAFVYNGNGDILAHPDRTLEGKNVSELPYGDKLQATKNGFFSYDEHGIRHTVYTRNYEPWDWNITVGLDDAEMLQGADERLMLANGVAAVLLLAVAALLALGMRRVIASPLRRLAGYTKEVASGNYDAAIAYDADDAIGQTVAAVKEMVGEIKHKIGVSEGMLKGMAVPFLMVDTDEKITHVNRRCLEMLELDGKPADYLGWSMGKLFYNDPARSTVVSRCMKERSTVHDLEVEIAGHKGSKRNIVANVTYLEDLDSRVIGGFCIYLDMTQAKLQEAHIREQNEKIARVALEANAIAEQVSSAAEQLSAQVEQATRGAEVQSQHAGETASFMEEMNATVIDVTRNASHAAASADVARAKAQDGAAKVGLVVDSISDVDREAKGLRATMDELGRQAGGIGQIIGVINDIADQTNLLALNAAIEAARAGDAGRGFAVVADEVRKLAEKTMTATKEVGAAISAIQQGTEKSVVATGQAAEAVARSISLANESGASMREIVAIVEGTASEVRDIATTSEEQSASSEEIRRSVEHINRISSETAAGMRQSSQAVTDLARQAEELKQLIEEMQQ